MTYERGCEEIDRVLVTAGESGRERPKRTDEQKHSVSATTPDGIVIGREGVTRFDRHEVIEELLCVGTAQSWTHAPD